jgi:hypothetical protein
MQSSSSSKAVAVGAEELKRMRVEGHPSALFVDQAAIRDFECAICTEVMRDAVALPCGHEFCEACLEALFDRNKKQNPLNHDASKFEDAMSRLSVVCAQCGVRRAVHQIRCDPLSRDSAQSSWSACEVRAPLERLCA